MDHSSFRRFAYACLTGAALLGLVGCNAQKSNRLNRRDGIVLSTNGQSKDAQVSSESAATEAAATEAAAKAAATAASTECVAFSDIQNIATGFCAPCHSGATISGGFDSTKYVNAATWQTPAAKVAARTMPPASFSAMPASDMALFAAWANQGYPQAATSAASCTATAKVNSTAVGPIGLSNDVLRGYVASYPMIGPNQINGVFNIGLGYQYSEYVSAPYYQNMPGFRFASAASTALGGVNPTLGIREDTQLVNVNVLLEISSLAVGATMATVNNNNDIFPSNVFNSAGPLPGDPRWSAKLNELYLRILGRPPRDDEVSLISSTFTTVAAGQSATVAWQIVLYSLLSSVEAWHVAK